MNIRLGWIVFFLASITAIGAPWTRDNAPWNINLNPDGTDPSKYFGDWKGHRYFPSPQDWRDVAVYQFITDRFRDGDPKNNEGRYGGVNHFDMRARHGGDFKGITQKLHYIKALGFDGIWISPIFQNRTNSYHGYAQIDFTILDDRFGTLDDFRAMVDEAHRLGMYVIVDIVVNHLDNLLYFDGHPQDGAPFRLHAGEYQQFYRDPNERYLDFWVNNDKIEEGNYCDVYGDNGLPRKDPGSGSFWLSDFHHNGDLGDYGDPWQNHLGKIYGGMDDLRTTHPRVQDKIIAMTKALISSTDIDGIRMDTPMQVPLYFFKRWTPAIKEHAKRLGKDNFFVFGEFYCSRERAATMVGRGKTPEHRNQPFAFIDDVPTMDAGINYRFYYDFVAPAIKEQKGKLSQLKKTLDDDLASFDFYEFPRQRVSYRMLNFINNHDQWRLNVEPDGFQKTMLGSAIIAFWPGIPLFYFGDEQGFITRGSAVDGDARESFMVSKAWYDRPSSDGSLNPAVFDNFNMTHPHFQYVQKVMGIRKKYFALRSTDEVYERWLQTNDTNGIYAFTRVWGEGKNWALVVFNSWRDKLTAGGSSGDFYTGWPSGTKIVNVLDPSESYRLEQDGKLRQLVVNGYETKVFVSAENFQPLPLTITSMVPAHDQVVSAGPQKITIGFSEPVEISTLKGKVLFNGEVVDKFQISANSMELSFEVQVGSGLYPVELASSISSQKGEPLVAKFTSRFRSGNSQNPIIQMQREPIEVQLDYANQTLRHNVPGAESFRVSNDHGKSWTQWMPYQELIKLPDHVVTGAKSKLLLQYYADGSSAYFVEGTLR